MSCKYEYAVTEEVIETHGDEYGNAVEVAVDCELIAVICEISNKEISAEICSKCDKYEELVHEEIITDLPF